MITIAFINRSTVWTDAEAELVMTKLQIQVSRDFAPVWNADCKLMFFGFGAGSPPPDAWWLVLLDNTDDQTALGYHEMTSTGMPIGKCFLHTSIVDGGMPSIVVSHELLEMLADPWISDLVLDNHESRPQRLYAAEVCDACEDDPFGYDIDGVTVSDFVFPSWFESWRDTTNSAGVQFDFQKRITQPFELLSGGYISYMNITGGGWQQLTADLAHKAQYRAQVGTRRERRHLPKNFWRKSAPHPAAISVEA